MDMRTPLGRVRGLGSAREGTGHFIGQRLSAVLLVPLVLLLLIVAIRLVGAPHAQVVETVKSPFVAVPLLAAILAGVWHMKLGMQTIIEDYAHGGMRVALMVVSFFFCGTIALTCVWAVLKISFGL